MTIKTSIILCASLALASASLITECVAADTPAVAPPTAAGTTWTTLGTNSGPIPKATRSEPANLLRSGGQTILVDVGDGAAEQLAKAGVPIGAVQTLFISHHHFDHTGGLFALLGMRYQILTPGVLAIYGPPGTKELVDGLIAAMKPMAKNVSVRARQSPEEAVRVVEIGDGSKVMVGAVAVMAASNSHYTISPGSAEAAKFVSLSFRFDAPDRSIVYTGDTGPSENVERLARGADLLVSEIMDPGAALASLKAARPDLPPSVLTQIEQHFRTEHLAPDEVGKLAERSGVKALVLTHNPIDSSGIACATKAIMTHYKGPITFAADLDKF